MFKYEEEYDEDYEYNVYIVLLNILFYIMLFLFNCLVLYIKFLTIAMIEICNVIIMYGYKITKYIDLNKLVY
jgi:hypothetical protein